LKFISNYIYNKFCLLTLKFSPKFYNYLNIFIFNYFSPSIKSEQSITSFPVFNSKIRHELLTSSKFLITAIINYYLIFNFYFFFQFFFFFKYYLIIIYIYNIRYNIYKNIINLLILFWFLFYKYI